jgi:hypothetical protein
MWTVVQSPEATMADAEEFARSERQSGEGGPPWARGTFGRKRVDGLRIYIGLIPGGI